MKNKHLAALLQTNMTTVKVVFSDSDFQPYPAQPVVGTKENALGFNSPHDIPWGVGYGLPGTPAMPPRPRGTEPRGPGLKAPKTYTYKVLKTEGYKKGDVAVAHTDRGMVLVLVVEVHEHPQIDIDAAFDYKWLVQRVDTKRYEEQLKAEKNFEAALLEIERRKQTERLKNELLEMYGDTVEGRQLLEQSIQGLTGAGVTHDN